jgi:hypothetical protein
VETEHSSTSMTDKLALLFLLTLISITFAASQQETASGMITPKQRVARLGAHGNDDVADIKELAMDPRSSAGLLIVGLHTVPDSKKTDNADRPSVEHVLWLIRGLRYVTGGIDFCASSKHVFGNSEEEKNRKYWLTFHHKECLTFWGYWMSRDRTYIAPADAQENIISQWHHWYATYGAEFAYKPLENPPPEKWLW